MNAKVTIEEAGNASLIVRFPYSPESVAKIKTIDGRRWHEIERYWTVPNRDGVRERLLALFEEGPPPPAAPPAALPPATGTIEDRVRRAARTRHFSPSTEKRYVAWTRRFLERHPKADPLALGEAEIGAFLTRVAEHARVSASTQNQALKA